jgi:hypothetical protein
MKRMPDLESFEYRMAQKSRSHWYTAAVARDINKRYRNFQPPFKSLYFIPYATPNHPEKKEKRFWDALYRCNSR